MSNSDDRDFNNFDSDNEFNFKKNFLNIYIIGNIFTPLCFFYLPYTYLRYSEKLYVTKAKIQIIDEKRLL